MRCNRLLAVLAVVCLSRQTNLAYAQLHSGTSVDRAAESARARDRSIPCARENSTATGRIAGVVKDQTGAVVPGVRIEAVRLASSIKQSLMTDYQGHFVFDTLPVGRYQVTVIASGFEIVEIDDISVTACNEATVNIVLKIAQSRIVVQVNAAELGAGAATSHLVNENDRASSRNTAELLGDAPGVSLRENGQLASIPLLHGLGDERTKLVFDGMTRLLSLPQPHEPTAFLYFPAQAAKITVMAGITPVSLGGDSIGGTVSVEFAAAGICRSRKKGCTLKTASSGFYRSNGQNYGGSLHGMGRGPQPWARLQRIVGHQRRLHRRWRPQGHFNLCADHRPHRNPGGAGRGQPAGSSGRPAPHSLRRLCQRADGPGAQLCRVSQPALPQKLRRRACSTRIVYWQGAWHSMNIGRDKSTFPMPMWMPMNTHGRDLGYSVKVEVPLSARHTLRVGNELHRFVLDDSWPAVPGTAPMMGPNTFVSINDGRRIRLGTFAEVASKWNRAMDHAPRPAQRYRLDQRRPGAGLLAMMYGADADAFNALNRAQHRRGFRCDRIGALRAERSRAPMSWLCAQDAARPTFTSAMHGPRI